MFRLLASVIVLGACAASAQDAARRFHWEQATRQMTEGQYAQAAQTYHSLLDREHLLNPALLHNLTAAHILAKDPVAAQSILDRLQRYTGQTPDTLAAQAAIHRLTQHPTALNDLKHTLFYWHYRYACAQRVQVLLVLWSVLWLALISRRLIQASRPHAALNALTHLLHILTLAAFLSVAHSALQELTYEPIPPQQTP